MGSDGKDSNEDGVGATRDELCLRVFTESMPFLCDNPALKRLEDICKKDNDYMTILNHIRAGKSFRDLPPSSEGSKMGGEWAKLRVLDKFEIVVLRESDSVSKIFPPVAYRAHIMEELHRSGKKEDSIFLRIRLHYMWPNIKKDVRSHVESCKKCAELMPSKPQARASGLTIPLHGLNPMDWLSTDICQKKLSNVKKANFLIIVDRASGFIRAYLLKGTKTPHVIEALQDYINVYVGPPYWLTSDGGPQFAATNAAIKKWAEEAGILHTLSAAYNPEGNGEAKRAVQAVKKAISHNKSNKLHSIQSIIDCI